MILYIAGPMRRRPRFNFPAFFAAANDLEERGHTVLNPALHDIDELGFNGADHDPWNLPADAFDMRSALQWDLDMICHRAEGLVLLDGWHTSAGARLEVAVADKLDLPKWAVEEIPEIPT